jgi:hypothetical protein
MTGGGFVASYLMFRRVRKHTFRSGFLFGVSATIVNFVFGVATSAPSTPFVAVICFLAGAVLGVMLWRKKDKELESVT